MKTGVSVVIPCLNEEATIARAVDEARAGIQTANLDGEVIVVDNGSADQSVEIAKRHGARVVVAPIRGYGAAVDFGIRSATFSMVVFADADLSYPLLDLYKLVSPLLSGQAEFVLGNRLRGDIEKGAMPFLNRYLGTPVLSLLLRILHGLPTADCNSGMRAFLRHRYETLALMAPGMEYASEQLIQVAQHQLSYAEVDINFRRDQRGRPPHLRRWRDGCRHLFVILRNIRIWKSSHVFERRVVSS